MPISRGWRGSGSCRHRSGTGCPIHSWAAVFPMQVKRGTGGGGDLHHKGLGFRHLRILGACGPAVAFLPGERIQALRGRPAGPRWRKNWQMTNLGLSGPGTLAPNIMLILAVPAAIVLAAFVVARRIRNLEDRVRRLEESALGHRQETRNRQGGTRAGQAERGESGGPRPSHGRSCFSMVDMATGIALPSGSGPFASLPFALIDSPFKGEVLGFRIKRCRTPLSRVKARNAEEGK